MTQAGQVADFVTRLIAYIIDGVLIGIVNYVLWTVLVNIAPGFFLFNLVGQLLWAVIYLAIVGAYFVYFWTKSGATPGMNVMKIKVVHESGANLTQSQAITRYLYLGLPLVLSVVGGSVGGFGGFGGIGILSLLALAGFVWLLYLAYTTSKDARKQGMHDKAVGSLVVKA